jgi:hypothetical protein
MKTRHFTVTIEVDFEEPTDLPTVIGAVLQATPSIPLKGVCRVYATPRYISIATGPAGPKGSW